jgi:hypothetical protein
MGARARRIADLERQVTELAARLEECHQKAAMVRAFEDAWAAASPAFGPAVLPRRPRHLQAVPGGAR